MTHPLKIDGPDAASATFILAHGAGADRPDEESLGAAWFTVDEIAGLSLREVETLHIIRYVVDGGLVSPLSVIDRKD